MSDFDMVTTAEVAAVLDVARNTVRQMVEYGHLTPATKLPGHTGAYLFHRADVDALAARRRGKDAAEAAERDEATA